MRSSARRVVPYDLYERQMPPRLWSHTCPSGRFSVRVKRTNAGKRPSSFAPLLNLMFIAPVRNGCRLGAVF